MQPAASTKQVSGQRTSELIGRPVIGSNGEEVGTIRDFVVAPRSGQIRSVVVQSGGVLGVGGQRRAVPFTAISLSSQPDTPVRLDETLDSFPEFNADEYVALPYRQDGVSTSRDTGGTMTATTERARTSSDVASPNPRDWEMDEAQVESGAAASGVSQGAGATGGRDLLVTELNGRTIQGVEGEIGTIEDVVVNPGEETVSVLVDVDEAVGGTADLYVIGLNQFSISGQAGEPTITSRLTPNDFRGTANLSSTAGISSGRPYAWRGTASAGTGSATYSTAGDGRSADMASATATTGASSAAGEPGMAGPLDETVRFADATANPSNRPTVRTSPTENPADETSAVSAVRQSLQQDASLAGSARSVEVTARGDTIVLSGSVPNQEARDRIVRAARAAAVGQDVEDELTVRGAAE